MTKKFIQADQAGAEALIVAFCAPAGNYRKLFANGIKVHSYVAMHLFKKEWPKKMLEQGGISSLEGLPMDEMCALPIEELPKHPMWKDLGKLIKSSDDWPAQERYYFMGKQTAHSSNYGVGVGMFRMNTLDKSEGKIILDEEEAKRFLLTYHALFPEIQVYQQWVRQQVETSSMLYNLHGHPYIITSYDIQQSQWKEYYAWIPQSSVGEITNIAYARMYEYIKATKKQWDLLANTHDSYLIQCPEEEEIECAIKAKEFIEQEFTSPIDGAKFRMRSEVQSGYNWAPFHKDKNPKGLQEIKGI